MLQAEVSRADIGDFLIEQQIYRDQTFCGEFVSSIWTELRRREAWLGAAATSTLGSSRIGATGPWQDLSAQTFCVVVSLAPWYAGWAGHFGQDYTEQGRLFERLTIEALQPQFQGWTFQSTGWSDLNAVDLADVVRDLATVFSEEAGNVAKWASGKAHEAGLDVTWHLAFGDQRSGIPVYLAQCASGANWTTKLHTPELPVWTKLIDFTNPPSKALALPFALSDETFQQRRVQVEGLLLDRHRLLPNAPTGDWLSAGLRDDLVAWLTPRIDWLLSQQ